MPADFAQLKKDEAYRENLGRGVWLMDDHRWAFAIWAAEREHEHYTLVHADFHWDGVDDFVGNEEQQAKLAAASLEELVGLVEAGKWIRYDSFIAPAVRRGLVKSIHFFCLEDEGNDEGLDQDLLNRFGAKQTLYETAEELAAAQIEEPLIFDLCLDLFNTAEKFGEGELWDDDEVLAFIHTMRPLIVQAELVSVSLSFEYSGTADDTRHLAALVVPELLAMRAR